MGHSFIEVADRSVLLNDFDLTLIRHFIEREGRRSLADSSAPPGLRASFERFLEGFVDYGPGVFVADFSPMLSGADGQVGFLLSVFDRVARVLREFGGTIPLSYLEDHVNTPVMYWIADAETAPVLRALGRIWGLFTELETGVTC
jgi:hypothetical protein